MIKDRGTGRTTVPHVELLRYRGKNGGYACTFSTLWIARIIGTNGRAANLDQSTWHGMDEQYARPAAESAARFYGFEMIERHDDRPASEDGHPPEFGTY